MFQIFNLNTSYNKHALKLVVNKEQYSNKFNTILFLARTFLPEVFTGATLG